MLSAGPRPLPVVVEHDAQIVHEVRVADFAPVRGDPAEHPEAGDRHPDLAFKRDMDYLPLFHLYDGTVHFIVEYGLPFHLQVT